MSPRSNQPARPRGRAEVTEALTAATLQLIAERGTNFSVREVADRADVNHALIYRHFGSKTELISTAVAKAAADLEGHLRAGASPVDLLLTKWPDATTITARMVLSNDTSLMPNHPALAAIVDRAAGTSDPEGLPAEARAALATAIALGWALFGGYLLGAARTEPTAEIEAELRRIVDELIDGDRIAT